MNSWLILGIIVLVIGMILSNIMLLKYSAKFKFPRTETPPKAEPDRKDGPSDDEPDVKS